MATMRRGGDRASTVTYGWVGGTRADDLLDFPPKGYRASEQRIRIGSGRRRFDTAADALMHWRMHEIAGVRITDVVVPEAHDVLVERAARPTGAGEDRARDDEDANDDLASDADSPTRPARIVPGTEAVARFTRGRVSIGGPVRVVYSFDETDRAGFAYGTLEGNDEDGEFQFAVTNEGGRGVWLTVRSFSRLAEGRLRLMQPLIRRVLAARDRAYLAALHPAGEGVVPKGKGRSGA